jgi:hypothetical protein
VTSPSDIIAKLRAMGDRDIELFAGSPSNWEVLLDVLEAAQVFVDISWQASIDQGDDWNDALINARNALARLIDAETP